MMNHVIHKHLDRRLDIQESSALMLEDVLDEIDIRAVLKNPKSELARVAHVAIGVVESHAKEAAKEGLRFAKEVLEKGKVVFVESENSKLNEGDAPGGD